MSRFLLAFDDSENIESLCTWSGDPIAGDHPIVLLTGFYLREEAAGEFNAEWADLRASIQQELGCENPPPIHLRLMWGKSLPRKYRGAANPYLQSNFNKIKQWVGQAWDIVSRFIARREAGWFVAEGIRENMSRAMPAYFQHPDYSRELRILRKALGNKGYRAYHRLTTSPLLPLYTRSLTYANTLADTQRPALDMNVLVDAFSDSHGIDELETVEVIRKIGNLQNIATVTRIDDSDNSPAVQAADLIGYCEFRQHLERIKAINPDAALAQVVGRRQSTTITSANISHLVRRRHPHAAAAELTMQYALARAHLEQSHPHVVNEFLVTASDFHDRAIASYASKVPGVKVLKDELLTEI